RSAPPRRSPRRDHRQDREHHRGGGDRRALVGAVARSAGRERGRVEPLSRALPPAYRARMLRCKALVAMLCVPAVLAGCAPTSVSPSMIVAPPTSLPKPERIAVYDFVVEANDVSPNNAPLSRLMRAVGSSQTADQLKTGRSVANTLSVELVAALKDLQLPVERGGTAPVADRTLAIEGQFISIDEGNRLRRVAIGLGAG